MINGYKWGIYKTIYHSQLGISWDCSHSFSAIPVHQRTGRHPRGTGRLAKVLSSFCMRLEMFGSCGFGNLSSIDSVPQSFWHGWGYHHFWIGEHTKKHSANFTTRFALLYLYLLAFRRWVKQPLKLAENCWTLVDIRLLKISETTTLSCHCGSSLDLIEPGTACSPMLARIRDTLPTLPYGSWCKMYGTVIPCIVISPSTNGTIGTWIQKRTHHHAQMIL